MSTETSTNPDTFDEGSRPASAARIPVELPEGMSYAVEAGVDPLDDLTVAELSIVGRQIKCDPYEAMGPRSEHRWDALARIAWLWAKRRDAHAKLQPYLDLTGAQLTEVLRLNDRQDDADQDVAENPTDHAPAS